MLPVGVDFTFNDHRSLAHNPLNYLYFIMSIWHQAKSEDTSLEIYVRKCLQNGDVHWFPTGVLHEVPAVDEKRAELLDGGEDSSNIIERKASISGAGGGGGGHHGSHHDGGSHGGGGGHGHHGGGANTHGGNGRHSPADLHKSGAKLTRQGTMFRKSLLFQGDSSHNMNNGMDELMDKMNNMQKQIMRLSKDLSGRDRLGSQPNASFDATNTYPSPSATGLNSVVNTPVQAPIGRKTIIGNKVILTRDDDEDGSSSNVYSSTESSDDQITEEGEENEDDDGEKTGGGGEESSSKRMKKTEFPPIKSGGLSPRRTNMTTISKDSINLLANLAANIPAPKPSAMAKSPKVKRETTKTRLSELSVHTKGSSRKTRSRAPSEYDQEMKTKVDQMDNTLLLIMKKLELMESRYVAPSEGKKNGQLSPPGPELNSNTTSKSSHNAGKVATKQEVGSENDESDDGERRNLKKRPKSAAARSDEEGDNGKYFSPTKQIQRPQSAHPYSPQITNIPLLMQQPHDLVNRIKKHKAKSQQKYKEKEKEVSKSQQGLSGPPKALITNLWVNTNTSTAESYPPVNQMNTGSTLEDK
jgi:hypothetical protein